MPQSKQLYGEIAKVEEQDDGTIKVYGYASSEAVDSDGEVIKADAMQAAITDYMKFPAVREMHQPIAAGTGIVMKVEDDGRTWFGAHVVDPVAVKKVINKVYRGFSIGAKVTSRDDVNKAVITGIKLKEVSLVDRPANPEATIELWKADMDAEEAVEELATLVNDGKVDVRTLLKLAKSKTEVTKPETEPEKPETEVTKDDTGTDVKKGLWDVRSFAEVLIGIGYLCDAAKSEAAWEGDNSPIPAALKAWVAQGADIFKQMAAEEVDELVAMCNKTAADREADLMKAGARYSKATKGMLAGIHKMIRDCDKALADMGYETAEEEDEGTKVEKADAPAPAQVDEKIEKALSPVGDLLKALVEKVSTLEKQPAAPKGALMAVDKADEVSLNGNGGDKSGLSVDPVKKADGEIDVGATAIKFIHKHGARPFNPLIGAQ